MRIVGTSPAAIDLAEERGAFGRVLARAKLPSPKHGMAESYEQARGIAEEIGYPVLVRPSYVLGGRGAWRSSTTTKHCAPTSRTRR